MPDTSRPNVILICSDHHRADALGSYGNRVCRTPTLDRLAAAGVQFNRCFSQNPVCMPARASMMTGTNNRRNGTLRNGPRLPRLFPTVADILKAHGYATAAVGKLHLTPQNEGVAHAPYYGYDQLDSVEDNSVGPYLDWALASFPEYEGYLVGTLFNLPTNEDYWRGRRDFRKEYMAAREKHVTPLEISRACNWGFGHYSPLPEEAHKNTWITERAISCIERHPADLPLHLWVGYVDPHNPFDPPKRFRDLYPPETVDERFHRDGEEDLWPPHHRSLRSYFREYTEQDWRTLRALFYGSITFMDEQIGRLITAIERKLDMTNTIIVYTADHGDILGDHGICGKTAYHYDGCIRVPSLWRWDGHWMAGARVDEIVEQTDLLPTLLDAMGVRSESVMDGRSVKPLLTGSRWNDARGCAYSESFTGAPEDTTRPPGNWARTIRSGRWRCTFYPKAEYGELFDMLNDPRELFNLWYEPEFRGVIEEHRRILLDRLILMDYPLQPPRYAV